MTQAAALPNLDNYSIDQLEDLARQLRVQELVLLSQEFTLEGAYAYFELIQGSPPHPEGRKWIANIMATFDSTRKLLQECFRGSGKTTTLTQIFFSWWLGHHPHTTNGIIRANQQKADESAKAVADIIANDPRFKLVFPHVAPVEGAWGVKSGYTLRRTDMSDDEWQNLCRQTTRPAGPTFIGYSYDSNSIQGFRVNGLLIVDDIHTKENTGSFRQKEDVKGFVRQQLLPIPVPNQGLEAWNFTPWDEDDAYAERKGTGLYIHSRSPVMVEVSETDEGAVLWPEHLEWPAHIKSVAAENGIDLDASVFPFDGRYWRLAWPERWGIQEIAFKYLDIGHIAFAREYLLDLTATRGQTLKFDWLGFWDGDLDPSWPVFIGVDYASVSDKLRQRERDYAAFCVGRAIPGGGVVIETGRFGHFTKAESLAYLNTLAGQYPTLQQIKVETLGKGEEFYNDAVLLNDVYGKPLPLSKIESHGKTSKGERFEHYLAPRFQHRRLWLRNYPAESKNEFIEEFIKEWLSFPNGRYDDVIDAVYMMAVGAEGFMPSKAERSTRRKSGPNPYAQIGASLRAS